MKAKMAGAQFIDIGTGGSRVAKTSVTASGHVQSRWLAVDQEREFLLDAWAKHESWLARSHGWFKLSDEARNAHPGNVKFAEIEERLAALETEGAACSRSSQRTPPI